MTAPEPVEPLPGAATLFEQAPCGLLVLEAGGLIRRVNQTLLDWTGQQRTALEGVQPFWLLLTVPGRLFYENQVAPLLRLQGFVHEVAFELLRPGRAALPVLANLNLHPAVAEQPAWIAVALMAATQRRRYEQELLRERQRAERLAAIVRDARDAILTLSVAGLIETWNAGATALFGYRADQMIGQPVGRLVPTLADAAERQRLVAAWHAGRTVPLELVGRDAAGQPVDVSVSLTPHYGLLGELSGLSAIIQDSRERRALERQQREFVATIAHEVKNPLAGISGLAQRLRRQAGAEAERLGTIAQLADQVARLIDDLVEATQLGSGQLTLRREPVALAELLQATAEGIVATSPAHRLRLVLPDEPVIGHWDRHRLAQIIQNLVGNGVKYSPTGGEITVSLSLVDTSVELTVEDQGPGIPSAALPHLFERYYRTAAARASRIGGLGLGLAIVRELVAAHGGRIAVESTEGVGSRFIVHLPLGVPPSVPAPVS